MCGEEKLASCWKQEAMGWRFGRLETNIQKVLNSFEKPVPLVVNILLRSTNDNSRGTLISSSECVSRCHARLGALRPRNCSTASQTSDAAAPESRHSQIIPIQDVRCLQMQWSLLPSAQAAFVTSRSNKNLGQCSSETRGICLSSACPRNTRGITACQNNVGLL